MKLGDFKGLLRKHTLPLLRSFEAEDGNTVFEFDITATDITWKPGQHGIFTLPDKKVDGKLWRAFSVSSIPSENMLQIATKISDRPSSFKKALRSMQPGEKIQVRGPFGWMYFQDHNSPVVMIAGGVGITPFRALFKALEEENHRDVTLIYSAKDTYLFKDKLNEIAAKYQRVNIVYTHTKAEVDEAINKTLDTTTKDTYFFLSGTPSMVKSTTTKLREFGILKSKIITDSFQGY